MTHPVGSLQKSGLLWALNAHVLHPRGFNAVVIDGELFIDGDGGTLKSFEGVDPVAVDDAWRRFRQTLLDTTAANKTAGPIQTPRSTDPTFVDPFPKTRKS